MVLNDDVITTKELVVGGSDSKDSPLKVVDESGNVLFKVRALSGNAYVSGYNSANSEVFRITNAGMAIGSGTLDAKAVLTLTSTTQGFLPPRMTGTQRDAITTPGAGNVIYNTTTNKLNVYNGSAWEAVTSA